MTPTDIGLIVVVVGVIIAVVMLWPKKTPKEHTFRCRRCRTVTTHTSRTIDEWQKGKKEFSCDTCHRQWHVTRGPRGRSSR
jgi:predicted SprT family Zn-dependent metalloprotease